MDNIYLVGMRGSGKTTVGRILAERLGRPFRDLDPDIEEKARMSISEFVKKYSWNDFRELERQVVQDISKQSGYVVGTGGGVLTFSGNTKSLNESGEIVFLKATPATLAKHLEGATDRPSLTGEGVIEEIAGVWEQRKGDYQHAAHHIIEIDNLSPEQVASKIMKSLQNHS